MYISEPPSYAPVSDTAVLYLTNVYGLDLVENKLYAGLHERNMLLIKLLTRPSALPIPSPGPGSSLLLLIYSAVSPVL